jgi:hypothetical protein
MLLAGLKSTTFYSHNNWATKSEGIASYIISYCNFRTLGYRWEFHVSMSSDERALFENNGSVNVLGQTKEPWFKCWLLIAFVITISGLQDIAIYAKNYRWSSGQQLVFSLWDDGKAYWTSEDEDIVVLDTDQSQWVIPDSDVGLVCEQNNSTYTYTCMWC